MEAGDFVCLLWEVRSQSFHCYFTISKPIRHFLKRSWSSCHRVMSRVVSKLIGLGIAVTGYAVMNLMNRRASIAVTHSIDMYKFFTQN